MRTRGIYPAGRMLSLCLALVLLTVPVSAALSGCHGRQERASFSVPESFDEAREYEIVFWAKNDTGRRTYTSALFRNLRHCIPISTSN